MQQKPEAFSTFFAETFKQSQVAADYRFRPPYPEEVFTILSSFLVDDPRTILDVGTGSGDIARPCTAFASRVDAVDISQEMIALGKQLPGGDNSRLHWIYGHIEDVPLNPPYALITAGSSIHWPDWSRTFPRFREMLTPNGYLAILYHNILPPSWDAEVKQLCEQYGIQRNVRSISAIAELGVRGFIHIQGRKQTTPVSFQQTVGDYIRHLNSHSSIARAREQMSQQQTAEFDAQVSAILLRYHPSGLLPLQVIANITYCIIPDNLT